MQTIWSFFFGVLFGITLNLRKPRRPHHKLVIIFTFNNLKLTTMSATIQVKQNLSAILGLVDDVTKQPVTATFENTTFASSDEAIFTTAANTTDPNEQDITGVAAGAATLNVSADATFVDSNGDTQTKTLTASIPVTVASVADGVDLAVTFGAATASA